MHGGTASTLAGTGIIRTVAPQPTGTVTLLFSDIEGSTRLLEQLGPARFADALDLHRLLLRQAFAGHEGHEVDTEGDAFFVAFARASDALAAAGDGQLALAHASWPDGVRVRVRMGIHTGEPLSVATGYVGMDVHRAARIMAAAHGGQVVVSETTRAVLDERAAVGLRDLGPHRLKDLLAPVRLFQLLVEGEPSEFPPLRSLHRTNLPIAPWPLLGREAELAEIRRLTEANTRLITLTGPGGTGKTRLALQAAAEMSDRFTDGVFFVPLAALRDTGGVGAAVAEAIGLAADDDPVAWLAPRRALLVLDNLEQLRGVAKAVAPLLTGDSVVLATSRAPLRLSAEHELPVSPLDDVAAVELFVSRAASAGRHVDDDPTVRAICRRLDNLPLAIELAAARSKLLAPATMLQRLDATLSVLSGGAADLPERQQTIRSTIAWSHDLLDDDARIAFRRLSVFRGSFALEDGESIAETDLDAIGTLVDQSLVIARLDGRFQMLETIRAFGHERLEAAGETRDFVLRHARHYLSALEAREPLFRTDRVPEVRQWYEVEEDNLRTMLDRLIEHAPGEAARAGYLLGRYLMLWGSRQEARRRLVALAADDRLDDLQRAIVLVRLASLCDRLGDLPAGTAAAERAELLTRGGRDPRAHVDALGWLTLFATRRGDHETAVRHARDSLAEAAQLDRSLYLQTQYDLGAALGSAGHVDEARTILRRVVAETRAIRDVGSETFAAVNLAELELGVGEFREAEATYQYVIACNERYGDDQIGIAARVGRAIALAGLDRRREARGVLVEAFDLLHASVDPTTADLGAVAGVIALASEPSDARLAARLRGAAIALRVPGSSMADIVVLQTDRLESPLIAAIGPEAWAAELEAGRSMSLDATLELARALGRR